MSLAFDAFTAFPVDTVNISGTHTPVGTPAAVLVTITQVGTDADEVSAVTYGGVAMTRVRFDVVSTGEPGATYIYELLSSIPTGAQTVSVTVTGATSKRVTAATVTSAGNAARETANGGSNANATNPTVTLTTGVGVETFVLGVCYSGDSEAAVTAAADLTELDAAGIISGSTSTVRRTANATGGAVSVGWIYSNDEFAGSAIALKETDPPAPPDPVGRRRSRPLFVS